MSAEHPPAQNADTQVVAGGSSKERGLVGGTLHEISTNPGLRQHAMRLGAEMLVGAGVLAETVNGRRFSLSGFTGALREPKQAFEGAVTKGAPHAARLAGHAALVGVNHLTRRKADGMTMQGESQKPATQA